MQVVELTGGEILHQELYYGIYWLPVEQAHRDMLAHCLQSNNRNWEWCSPSQCALKTEHVYIWTNPRTRQFLYRNNDGFVYPDYDLNSINQDIQCIFASYMDGSDCPGDIYDWYEEHCIGQLKDGVYFYCKQESETANTDPTTIFTFSNVLESLFLSDEEEDMDWNKFIRVVRSGNIGLFYETSMAVTQTYPVKNDTSKRLCSLIQQEIDNASCEQ